MRKYNNPIEKIEELLRQKEGISSSELYDLLQKDYPEYKEMCLRTLQNYLARGISEEKFFSYQKERNITYHIAELNKFKLTQAIKREYIDRLKLNDAHSQTWINMKK